MTASVFPTISAGGTSGTALFSQYLAARDAVDAAVVALRKTAPNGRDYPDRADLTTALREHRERVAKLQGIMDELWALAEVCAGSGR